jgi:hypothetical protein
MEAGMQGKAAVQNIQTALSAVPEAPILQMKGHAIKARHRPPEIL